MNIFDSFVYKTEEILSEYEMFVSVETASWPIEEKAQFIMERDTAVELGGYPKDSINLLLSSSSFDMCNNSVIIVGDGEVDLKVKSHISFGKIVLLKTREVPDDEVYEFTQKLQISEVKFNLNGVMQRSSSERFFTNLRISKQAIEEGFSLPKYGNAVCEHFKRMDAVECVKVILILGESLLYKQLLPIAEDVKKVTIALNTIFDGIDMECGSCNLNEICDEVEGLRRIHNQRLP